MAAQTEILLCPQSLQADAIELVLRELPPELQIEMVASLEQPNETSLGPFDALFVALRAEQLVAAVWAQPQPGRTATLWLPQFTGSREDQLASELIAVATRRTSQFDTAMLQAILEPNQTAVAPPLLEAGFIHVANLIYLEWLPQPDFRATLPNLRLESYHKKLRGRLKRVLGASYIGSLDCPQLDALRTLDDTLAGYQATGQFDPTLWMIAVEEGHDVGALLLAPHLPSRQLELIYMGVIPDARGRGIGAALLAHAQALAVERRVEKILLAVDVANIPARKLYDRAGFQQWSRRSVYVRSFSPSG